MEGAAGRANSKVEKVAGRRLLGSIERGLPEGTQSEPVGVWGY